jgi:hypothetical protein
MAVSMAKFQKGHKFAKGGARKGSGRKPNWLKALCEEEMQKNKAQGIRLIGQIARGEAVVEKVMHEAFKIVRIKTAASPGELIQANEFLRDTFQGRPTQAVDLGDATSINLFTIVQRAEEERGLPSSFEPK